MRTERPLSHSGCQRFISKVYEKFSVQLISCDLKYHKSYGPAVMSIFYLYGY